MIRLARFLAAAAATVLLAGCYTSSTYRSSPGSAPINHIVFLKLHDPSMIPQLLGQSDSLLGTIPSVVSYIAGTHIDIGRDSVLRDYDVAIVLGFDSAASLREYVAHPQHLQFVNAWRSRLEWLRVYDVGDDTP